MPDTSMDKPIIDANRVEAIIKDCLFRDDELKNGKPITEMVEVKGIMHNMGFHKERLLKHRDEVKIILNNLPEQFHKNIGGGWSFLNACQDKNDIQWTGLHERMEQLFLLGLGLGLCEFTCSRDIWPMMPGGMPYITILE